MISLTAYRAKIGSFVMPPCRESRDVQLKTRCKKESPGVRVSITLLIALAVLLIIGCVELNPGPKDQGIERPIEEPVDSPNPASKMENTYTLLGLDWKQEIHLSDVMAITDNKVPSPLYKTILYKLVSFDCKCRDETVDMLMKAPEARPKEPQGKGRALFGKSMTKMGNINPMDALYACFQCSDVLLKQIIIDKLFLCRLAIPLVSPSSSFSPACFNLWALRGIVSEWCERGSTVEASIAHHPLKVLSFIRFGKIPISKSKVINYIMNDSKLNTFFNKDCPQGKVKRQLTNGMVEASFFFPTAFENSQIEDLALVSNLRGDAFDFKEMAIILMNASSYLFVFINIESLGDINKKDLAEFKSANVYFLILATEKDKENQDRMSELETFQENFCEKCNINIILQDMNTADMKESLCNMVCEVLPDSKASSIIDLAKIFHTYEVSVDEYDEMVDKCKTEAEKIMQILPSEPSVDYKQNVLPLQGKLWDEYVSFLRQANKVRVNDRTLEKVKESTKITDALRNQQVVKLESSSKPFQYCLERLKETTLVNNCSFTLQFKWYRLELANRALQILPRLRTEYTRQWTSYKKAKQDELSYSKTEIEKIAQELVNIEKKLDNTCFGINHILREIGQVFEALTEANNKPKKVSIDTSSLLDMGTDLLLTGNNLELMNGEGKSCHVPMTWITAVLDNLILKIGDKRLFVLSILGLQSSGKSTLLNAMFGVQFDVSTGRCTKGIYMQLVKVTEGVSLPYDYILVVDTEGLRAMEIDGKAHNRDNELATMAIGLGNVTIVNIKGESIAEIQDILQIAVQAFLRMKSVNPSIRLHQKCVFVHQNVAALGAKEKLVVERKKMQDALDKITIEAAAQESVAHITNFSDVIDFDSQEDVWYFPNLWIGNIPMAHVNPLYSASVQDVKQHICLNQRPEQYNFITINDFKIRVQDMWKAIMSDDFVYSFKNSFELKAFSELELNFNQICREFDIKLFNAICEAENKMKGGSTEEEFNMLHVNISADMETQIKSIAEDSTFKLHEFFDRHKPAATLAQWRNDTEKKMAAFAEKKEIKARENLLQTKQILLVSLKCVALLGDCEKQLRNKAFELAGEHNLHTSTTEHLKDIFDKQMQTLLESIEPHIQDEQIDIQYEMDTIFSEIPPKALSFLVKEEIERKEFYKKLTGGGLTEALKKEFIQKDDISLQECKGKVPNEEACLNLLHNKITVYFERLESQIIRQKEALSRFKASFAEQIFRRVQPELKEISETSQDFSITPKFKAKVYACIFFYALRLFEEMQNDYASKNGIKAKLNRYRSTTYKLFLSLVQERREEDIAADMFCERVKGLINDNVGKKIYSKVVQDLNNEFGSKFELIVAVLKDLAQKNDVENYFSYLRNSQHYTSLWLTKYVKNRWFCSPDDSPTGIISENGRRNPFGDGQNKTMYISCASEIIRTILDDVKAAVQGMEMSKDLNLALEDFRLRMRTQVAITAMEFEQVTEKRNIQNVSNFCKLVLEKMTKVGQELLSLFQEETVQSWKWDSESPPEKTFLDDVWGCEAICPFCSEPCQFTIQDHKIDHCCIQHRPQGLLGCRNVANQTLVYESCSFLISTDDNCVTCRPNVRKGICTECPQNGNALVSHLYSDYRKYTSKWKIHPSPTNDDFKYWQWVFAKYNVQFAQMFGMKPADLPDSWIQLTRDNAVGSLTQIYRATDK